MEYLNILLINLIILFYHLLLGFLWNTYFYGEFPFSKFKCLYIKDMSRYNFKSFSFINIIINL